MRLIQIISFIFISIFAHFHINATSHSSSILLEDPKKSEYVLFTDMKTNYSIFLSIDASESEIWAARNKMNRRHSSGVPVKVQPGGVESYWRVHTFHYLVPPAEFFDDHPEHYCLVDEFIKILNNAQNVADNYQILRRVEVATLPVLFLKSSRSPSVARKDGTFEKFLEILEKEGKTRIHEYGAGNDLESWKKWVLNAE